MKIPLFKSKSQKEPTGKFSAALFRAAKTVSLREQKHSELQKILKDPKLRRKKIRKKVPALLRFSYRTGKKLYHHQNKINKALLAVGNVVEYQMTKFR